MDGTPKKRVFVRKVVFDRDQAILYLKRAGFTATDDPDTFVREEARATHEKVMGARYTETVKLSDLLSDPLARETFVRRWSKRIQ